MNENLYPKLKDYNEVYYKEELERQRIINFKNDLNYLKQQIVHYTKLYKKWKQIDNSLRYFSVVISSVSSIGAVIILGIGTGGIASALTLPITLGFGSISIFTNFIDGVLSKTLSSRRKKKYQETLKIFEQAKNELFLFHQKAMKDGKLDDTEIEISHEIVERCKKIIQKDKDNNNNEIEDLKKQMAALADSIKSTKFQKY